MAYIEWTDKISVGNEEIDNQHKRLFDILNDLHRSVSNGAERSANAKVLQDLIDYTITHFETEESYFKELGYPHIEEHVTEHDDLTRQALDLNQKFIEGSITISFDVLDFLHDWLIDHTSDSDQKFARFYKEINKDT